MKNYGLDLAKLAKEIDGTEYSLGAVSKCIFEIPEEKRRAYLPKGEVQVGQEDLQDCASRGPVNLYENKFTYAYRENLLLPGNKKFLEDEGYVNFIDGQPYIEFSDAYIAIKSGTTRQGNSLKDPVQATHEWGLIPKRLMPLDKNMTWEEYHDPKRITPEIERIAKEFRLRFKLNYAIVRNYEFGDALSRGSLDVALFAWPFPMNGVYERTENSFNHAVFAFEFTNYYFIFDNYIETDGDFEKRLSPNYKFWDWGYHCIVTSQSTDEEVLAQSGVLSSLQELLNKIKKWLGIGVLKGTELSLTLVQQALVLLKKIGEMIKEIMEGESGQFPPNIFQPDYIDAMAEAIKSFEGWAAPGEKDRTGKIWPEGTVSWKRRNPGNIKGKDGKFLVFKTEKEGFEYLKSYLRRACKGEHAAYRPTMNIKQFFSVYAPASENSQESIDNYSTFVCNYMTKKLKEPVYPSKKLWELV